MHAHIPHPKGVRALGAILAPSGAKNWKLRFTNFTQLVY